MKLFLTPKKRLALLVLLTGCSCWIYFSSSSTIDYNVDIKPIFNKKCITCHGGVKRQSGFSLLFRTDALAINKSGKAAIIPGDPSHSEMIRRLTLKDPEERMPYKHPPLTALEIKTLKQWIKEGAVWGNHWAYIPVEKPALPKVDNLFFGTKGGGGWVKNSIDNFIYYRMKEEGLMPSPTATKEMLVRRVSLDIIGMPPPQSISQFFLKDIRSDAYEKLVDTLLGSAHYGERWASMWMDLARYADTKGYEKDIGRSIWRYRDWLIHAFNENKPYDEFITEQLAGDLLPNPTDAQYIATAFHRNTMTNDEGGTDNEEFRTAAVIDRVNTTWETIMGTTFSCVQCHSHPYDPFRHEEYYSFMAFFNNTRDEDTNDDYPLLHEFHETDSLKFIQLKEWLHQHALNREKDLLTFVKTGQPAINSIAADQLTNSALVDTKWLVLRNHAIARLPKVDFNNHSQILYRYKSWKPGGKWVIHLDQPNGQIVNSISVDDSKGAWKLANVNIPIIEGAHDLFFTYENTYLKTPEESGMQFDWFYINDPFPGKGNIGYDSAFKYFNDLLVSKQVTNTPVMVENIKTLFRPTHVFERGNWLVKGKEVQPAVPKSLGSLSATAPKNRLGMANWVTDKKNPLTARTIVNRIWEQYFGQGIVETLEDMGTQGIPPTHKSLLDYLAWKFMYEYNWDLKKLMREIVLSACYQQDSKLKSTGAEKDPLNKFYARGPRVRLSAEQIRDQALSVSGLLCEKMYGPGVFPYQPEGIWMSPYDGSKWKKSDSCDQYRRALYTYWKRTAPYPSMVTFDGTSHEVCSSRRIRTNTPLQSLTTLNDYAYIEAAQYFAYRMQDLGGNNLQRQISKGYALAMYKPISIEKLKVFEGLYSNAIQKFQSDTTKMIAMAGNSKVKQTASTAAMVVVAGAMMNLDEFITKN